MSTSKKRLYLIIIAVIIVIALLGVIFFITRKASENTADWKRYTFTGEEIIDSVFFKTDRESYNPKYIVISAQLMNLDSENLLICGEGFTVVKKVEDEWKAVPFAEGQDIFIELAYELEYIGSHDYIIKPERFKNPLTEGLYRIITDVWFSDKEVTLWAEFRIDKNAETQETMTIPNAWLGNFDGKDMTLDDVLALAAKGDDLLFEDFADFKCFNFSSNTNRVLMHYPIDSSYTLVIRGGLSGKPDSIELEHKPERNKIEIRYNNVNEFLKLYD